MENPSLFSSQGPQQPFLSSPKAHDGPLVMKFGGSSLKDAERMKMVLEIVETRARQRPVLVLSAMGKTTNALIEAGRRALEDRVVDICEVQASHMRAAAELGLGGEFFKDLSRLFDELTNLLNGIRLIQEISARTLDLLMSFGERLSVRMLAAYLEKTGFKAKPVDSWELGMLTTPGGGSATGDKGLAELLPETYDRIGKSLAPLWDDYAYTPVVTGFLAKDVNGVITTLGRGGSDFSAAVIGASINAKEIEIWTDVDGVMTCDPRVVPNASVLSCISFEEASELAYFGAKVLHPMTILPATEKGIPVRVKNSYNAHHPGTLILQNPPMLSENSAAVTAITYKKGVTIVDVRSTRMLGQHGFLARVFDVLSQIGISVDVLATSECSVSMTLEKDVSEEKLVKLSKAFDQIATVVVECHRAILTLIGNTMRASEIIATACDTFHKLGIAIDMVSCGASKVNVTFVVSERNIEECIKILHDTYFPEHVNSEGQKDPQRYVRGSLDSTGLILEKAPVGKKVEEVVHIDDM